MAVINLHLQTDETRRRRGLGASRIDSKREANREEGKRGIDRIVRAFGAAPVYIGSPLTGARGAPRQVVRDRIEA
jgi:hypothetical protein